MAKLPVGHKIFLGHVPHYSIEDATTTVQNGTWKIFAILVLINAVASIKYLSKLTVSWRASTKSLRSPRRNSESYWMMATMRRASTSCNGSFSPHDCVRLPNQDLLDPARSPCPFRGKIALDADVSAKYLTFRLSRLTMSCIWRNGHQNSNCFLPLAQTTITFNNRSPLLPYNKRADRKTITQKTHQIVGKEIMSDQTQEDDYDQEIRDLALPKWLWHPNITELIATYTYDKKHNFLMPQASNGARKDVLAGNCLHPWGGDPTAVYIALCGMGSAESNVHE